ncbi:MAG: DUF1553 domain-containing protein [Planctomycetota bacterium]|nr:MAG: DUF1553 domain-containing protein [Planctomycetota bacterium]
MSACMRSLGAFALLVPAVLLFAQDDEPATPDGAKPVSYYKDVRPIFQAHCQGCHQPAKASGEYVMTDFAKLVGGGETGEAAIVPGKPEESYLIDLITPVDGAAEMPKGKPALSQTDVDLITRWIAEGAEDDTPANAVERYDADHPPVYSRPPVVTSIDFSPDGSLLAISGFHEVLLHHGDGSGLVARLVGMSERIESVSFSPDGKFLAVTGGLPCRMGELQIWDVEKRELTISVPITFDTTYGASWSPDGTLVAVGCADKTVRAFNAQTGEQVFFNGAHDDWALNTVFSVDGTKIVSVGRDMATKYYDVPTQRFIDNVTSITPGALKGGLSALDRHPQRDEVLVGGSDGTPRIYRMERITKRVIGDDANLIRRFPPMRGRVFDVAYAPDGNSFAAVSSLDGKGQVFTYSAQFDPEMPEDIKGIVQKVVTTQSAEEKARLEEYVTADVKILTQTELPTAVYAVSYSPDGSTIVAAGADGIIRFINPADGQVTRELTPVEVDPEAAGADEDLLAASYMPSEEFFSKESLPEGASVDALEVIPQQVEIARKHGYVQLLVTGVLNSGDRVDLTRLADISVNNDAVQVSEGGRVTAGSDVTAEISITFGGQTLAVPVQVSGVTESRPMNFIRDVNPVISRLGCNAGTCHGAKDGKNGFKLSLRGYDPIMDVRAFTDDMASRRTNFASPDDSLMLLKATGAVPHVGGQLTKPGHPYYVTIRQWIAEGAPLDLNTPRVVGIDIEPKNPVIQQIGAKQQLRIVATYEDGQTRDVTGEAYVDSGNTEVAEVNRHALVTTIRRGEAPLLARYEGNYAATTVTSMGDRSGFVWQEPEVWNEVDRFVAEKWERMKILPSELCSDDEFLRRAYLDLTGLPPTAEEVRDFLADERETRVKRDEVVDKLIGSDPYIDYWTNKWADMLQVNRKFLGAEGAALLRQWIRGEVAENTPYDEFCYKVLTATGSNKTNPPASYFKILRDPEITMENTTHLFLAVRFNCNKCHDHPFERWTQDQYYETAAFFSQVGLKRDPENAEGNVGGTAVEGAKPLWEVVFDKTDGEVTHQRTGETAEPTVPYDEEIPMPESESASRREQFARWVTSPENDYFAKSYVNRIWGYLMGAGLIEPLDDIRAGNPPTNPELLDWLTEQFIASGFDVRQLMRTICTSRTYQLSIATNKWNEDDTRNYSHALPKRLPAETLYDAIYTVTGAKMQIPGVPEGTRAAAIPDAGVELADRFLANLGRPARESSCECERSSELQLGPVMALMNGPTVSEAISQPDNAIARLVAAQPDNAALVNELFLRILNRPARPEEIQATIAVMGDLPREHEALLAELADYQERLKPITAEKERRRDERIAVAQAALDAYTEEIRPRVEQAEADRLARIAAAEQALADYDAALPGKIAEWEKTIDVESTGWVTLDASELSTTTGATLEKQDDLSIFATGPNNQQGLYVVNAATELNTITGIMLEAIADDRLPMKGPGRAADGNFVLSELTLEYWPADAPDQKQTAALQNAKADFSQQGYDVATAIDGQAPNAGNGWALSGDLGKTHFATFELTQPITTDKPLVLSFSLNQQYRSKQHSLGRFRLSATGSQPPLQLGLPDSVLQVVKTAAEERSDEQRAVLAAYYKSIDEEQKTLQANLAEANKPLPEDPKLVALRNTLEEVKQPLPVDPQLARLQRAVELSQAQLQNVRLTTAQDLAWALINSPAFLFNR